MIKWKLNLGIIITNFFYNPGVIVTDLQLRGGMNEEEYKKCKNALFN